MKVCSIFLIIAVCLVFGVRESFAQCGADGKQPCTTTTKKTTPKKTTPKKTTPKQTTKPTTTKTTVTKQKPTPTKTTAKTNQAPREMTFVTIPAGEFQMGSNDYDWQKPVHTVKISKSFQMQTTEVTQAQWQAVMGSNPSSFKNCPDCPVESVSWDDVQDFIRKLNKRGEGIYRLPTEAEWEYACRASSTTKFSHGDGVGLLGNYAWYSTNSGDKTHPVGQKLPNEWGLYDIHGNVAEWCQDLYGDYSNSTQTDPTGSGIGSDRVVRGGGLSSDMVSLLSANRSNYSPFGRADVLGFRVVSN